MARLGKVDIRELRKMQEDLEKSSNQVTIYKLSAQIGQELAARQLRTVRKKTPTGKINGGTLKKGWVIEPQSFTGSRFVINVTNYIEYAPYVEYGHRLVRNGKTIGFVTGQFMMTRSEEEVGAKAQAIANKRVWEYLKRNTKL